MYKKLAVVAGTLLPVAYASAASVVNYAALATSVQTELEAGITAAMVGVGLIWGARIGLNFVRSIMR